MKLVILYLKTLKSFLQKSVTASTVLFVSIALVFLSSLYFVNAFMSYKSTLSGYYRMRTIECTYNARQSQIEFLNFPEEIISKTIGNVENIIFRYDDEEIKHSFEASFLAAYNQDEIEMYAPVDFTVVSYYDNSANDRRINKGENISEDDVKNSDNIIVYNKSIYTQLIDKDGNTIDIPDAYAVGDAIDILGKSYRIKGIINNFGYSIIPYTTGLKDLKLNRIDVNFSENATDEHKRALAEFIESEYSGLDAAAPPKIDEEFFKKISFLLFLLCAACAVGVFYLLYVYKYIVENNKRAMIINRMLGLTAGRSVLMILFQIFIINTFMYIVTALLYRFVFISIFGLYIPDAVFFIIIYLFVVSASSIIIYPFARKITRSIGAGGEGEA